MNGSDGMYEGYAHTHTDHYSKRIEALEKQVKDLRDIILRITWQRSADGNEFCIGCGGFARFGGHKPDCVIVAAFYEPPPLVVNYVP